MNVMLAVSTRLLPEEVGKPYWCARRNYSVQARDLVAVYMKSKGICQVFEVSDTTESSPQFECTMRGMTTIWLRHLLTLKNPLTAKAMKEHPLLRDMNALRRNFQMTTFLLDRSAWLGIVECLMELNPEQLASLKKLRTRK